MQSRIVWNTPVEVGQEVFVTVRATTGTGGWAEATMPIRVRSSVVSGYYTDPENQVIAFTPEQLVSNAFFVRSRSVTLQVVPPCGNHLTVKASYPGDSRWFVVGEASFAPGAALVEVTLGGEEDSLRRLPDEGIVRLRLEWGGCARPVVEMLGEIQVDRLPPRFVHALAPAGDFYANLPDPETVKDMEAEIFKGQYWPDRASSVDFYCTNAWDTATSGNVQGSGLQYAIHIWRPATGADYQTPWKSHGLPITSFTIGGQEDLSAGLVARGSFPTNVISGVYAYCQENDPGEGEYRWEVLVRDAAGNIARSSTCELWVPRLNESLWCNLYTDKIPRIRVPLWLEKDLYVPAGDSSMKNGEWRPYDLDDEDLFFTSSLTDNKREIIADAESSFSRRVFYGKEIPSPLPDETPEQLTRHRRNQEYAEYIWRYSMQWRTYMEGWSLMIEEAARRPYGAAYSTYYPKSLLPKGLQKLRPNLSRLESDGRMRIDILRDPYVNIRQVFMQPETGNERYYETFDSGGIISRLGSLHSGRFDVDKPFDEDGPALAQLRFFQENVTANSTDTGGFSWRWQAYGSPKINKTVDGFSILPRGLNSPMAWTSQTGGAGYPAGSGGAGGNAGVASHRPTLAPDPLQAVLFNSTLRRNETNLYVKQLGSKHQLLFSNDNMSAWQQYSQFRAIVDRSVIAETYSVANKDGVIVNAPLQQAFIRDDFPLLETMGDPRSENQVFGQPAGEKNLGAEFSSIGPSASKPWGAQGGADMGHGFHELGHTLCLFHADMGAIRGPSPGDGSTDIQTSEIMGSGVSYWKILGIYQRMGLDPLASDNCYLEPLLGIPEIDVMSIDRYSENAPLYAMDACAWLHPANALLAASRPFFRPDSHDNLLDPVARIAWPRDCTYILLKDDDHKPGVTDFPPIFQTADDQGTSVPAAIVSIFPWGHNFSKYSLSDTPISGPTSSYLYRFDTDTFGYCDTQSDVNAALINKDKTTWGFRYPRPNLIHTLTPNAVGNMGANGCNGVVVVYDHKSFHDNSTISSRYALRYVIPVTESVIEELPDADDYSLESTDYGNGQWENPYWGIDFALAVEKRRPHEVNGIKDPGINKSIRSYWFVLLPTQQNGQALPHLTSSVNIDISNCVIMGGGDSPSSVTVRLRPGRSGLPLVQVAGWQRDIVVGNMTLDGDGSRATWGIEVNSHDGKATCTVTNCRFGNLVIHHTSQGGIRVAAVNSELHVVNNTIAYCPKGIAVDSVKTDTMWGGGGEMFPRNGQKKYYNVSAVENNIIYEYSDYGIKIGQSTGTHVQQVQAWNPLAANHPFGEPNPIVPVKYNWVWREGSMDGCFAGADWYTDTEEGYGFPTDRLYGEAFTDPGLFDPANDNFRLSSFSNAKSAGNPYKIDAIKKANGHWWGKNRSLGAFKWDNPSDYTVGLGQ